MRSFIASRASPKGDKIPPHERSMANGLSRILPDDGHCLSWSDVIACLPVHALVFCVEVAGQNLGPPGESVAAAHLLSIVPITPIFVGKVQELHRLSVRL